MQYPVPQFTDVEDRIIGPLTLKQFLIMFGAGLIVFLIYTLTKSIPIMIFAILIAGLPAAAVSFGKINGRPMYQAFPFLLRFFTSPRMLVFHKETPHMADSAQVKNVETKKPAEEADNLTADQTQDRLKEINRQLEQQAQAQRELLKQKGF
ncbi:MAG TPA: PrgI family protein [Patescibacteria group bacterium]|nr:PrgI family protein [Patescibacteria group bacterium]